MPSRVYEKWRKAVRAGPVNLRALEADIRRLTAQAAEADTDLQDRRAALMDLRADLSALRDLRNFVAHGDGTQDPRRAASRRGGRAGAGTKRDAILAILADGQALHTSAIRELLLEAGEMRPDQASYHSLQVTLSQMFRADELDRVARGVYRLAPISDEDILRTMAHEA
jgi:hypothetical protein